MAGLNENIIGSMLKEILSKNNLEKAYLELMK